MQECTTTMENTMERIVLLHKEEASSSPRCATWAATGRSTPPGPSEYISTTTRVEGMLNNKVCYAQVEEVVIDIRAIQKKEPPAPRGPRPGF